MIDEFRTVIRVQFQDTKRELVEDGLQHRQQLFLIDAPDAADHLPLRHFIDRIQMIHSLDTVPVALMDRIDPHVPRGPLGIGPASFADGNPRWLGFRKLRRPLPVSHAVPQIVKMRRRNLRQVGILALAEDLPLPFYDSAGRRPTELLVSPIHFDQQLQILTRVFDRKSLPWTAPHGEFASGVVAPDQARNLRHAQPAQVAEQGSHPTALLLAQSEVLLLHQRGHDPLVNSAPALAGKIDLRTGLKEIINPIQRQRFRILHQNLHPPHSMARFRFQDHPALETKSISGSSRIGQFCAASSPRMGLQYKSRSLTLFYLPERAWGPEWKNRRRTYKIAF